MDTFKLDCLFECINSMKKLTKLHLLIASSYHLPDNFTVISQLNLFHLKPYSFDLVPFLSHISSNIILILSNVHFGPQQLEELIEKNPLVTERISGLDFGFFLSKGNRVENFSKIFHLCCDRLREMTFIDMMVRNDAFFCLLNFKSIFYIQFGEHLPLAEMVPSWNKLKKIKYFSFYLSRDQMPANSNDIYSYPQFESVTILQLEVFNISKILVWAIIGLFPNVKYLILKTDFEFSENFTREDFIDQLKQKYFNLKTIKL